MKLLSWNIRQGGGSRIPRIYDVLIAHDADVIVLHEFRTGVGRTIIAKLNEAGWKYCDHTAPPSRVNGICVLSRSPIRRSRPAPAQYAARWLELDIVDHGFTMVALHILNASSGSPAEATGAAKGRMWDAVCAKAAQLINEPVLLVGDLNTGLRRIDEGGSTFYCSHQFAALGASGWTDVWRHFHGSSFEPTWLSHPAGNPFRIDHAFAAPRLLPRVRGCSYSHAERDGGISDHSIVVVEIGT